MSDFDTEEAITGLVKRFAEGSEQKIFDNDFNPQIAFYIEERRDSPRVIFFPEMVNDESRGPISWAVHILAASLDSLAGIAFIHDGYRATQNTKTDGTPWGPGGMQEAFLNNTVDAHLVSESLYYSVVTKDTVHMAGLPYERTAETINFLWDDLSYMSTQQDEVQAAGYYPDMLRHAFGAPKIIDELTKQFNISGDQFGLDEESARLHTLSIAAKLVLVQTRMLCMVPCHTKEEQDLLQKSLKEGPFSEVIKAFDQDELDEIVTLEQAFDAPAFGEA